MDRQHGRIPCIRGRRVLVVLYPAVIRLATYTTSEAHIRSAPSPGGQRGGIMQDMGTGSEFYEDDEPVAKIVEAFERGEKGLTAPPPSWGHTEYLLLGGLG